MATIFREKVGAKHHLGDAEGLSRPKKAEKVANEDVKAIIEAQRPVRTSSQPPLRKLDTIHERTPTYVDLRRENYKRKLIRSTNLTLLPPHF